MIEKLCPIYFERQDTCPICESKRSIECYDTFNRPIQFTKILDCIENNQNFDLRFREFSYMKCKNCNVRFMLDWKDKNIPRPLVYKNILYEMLDKYY